MKKVNKKMLFIFIIVIISLPIMNANAASSATLENISYSYDGDVPAKKAEKIIRSIHGIPGDDGMEPFSILCIFGHSVEKTTFYSTHHNAHTTSPRCNDVTSSVEYCSRGSCDYSKVLSERSIRIHCH